MVKETLWDGFDHIMSELHRACLTNHMDLPPTPSAKGACYNINLPADLNNLPAKESLGSVLSRQKQAKIKESLSGSE